MFAGVRTLVVVSSLSFPQEELAKIAGVQFYEERLLCMLLLLRDPDLTIVYATSTRVDPALRASRQLRRAIPIPRPLLESACPAAGGSGRLRR